MAGRIRDDDIALVRERSPIDEVVGEQLQLRSAGGGSLKGLCPFHDEKTPSFHVTPARGVFFCFGCQEGGDVISFVQKVEHLSFAESVERLAARAGVQLRYEQGGYVPGQQRSQRARLYEAHRAAAEFYAEQLAGQEAQPARRFLAERGFERADAEGFGVGYAPTGWESLVRHLRARGFADQELVTGGLARAGQRGPIDRFRGRLVWPIRDITGEVIGFGARRLYDDDDSPKYLNTPETPIYRKGAVLYGIDQAKREIARRRQAVVVEGYTDVMACHLAGVPTAIATCGTAFGEEHIKILRRLLMDQSEFRGEVIFTFDGDAAGQRAATRAFTDEQKFVTQTFVAVQPDGLDPCELRVQRGDAAVRDLVAGRVPMFEFAIRGVLGNYDLDIPEGRVHALRAAAPMVASIRDRSLRPEYARVLAGWLGMEIETVRGAVAETGQPRTAAATRRRDGDGTRPSDAAVQVEREALMLAVQRPPLAGPIFDALDADVFTVPEHVTVREAVAAAGDTATAVPGPDWVGKVRAAAPDETTSGLVTRLAVEEFHQPDGMPDERYADAVIARLRELAATRNIAELKSRLQRLSPVEQQTEYNRLFGELVALEQHRHVLREQVIGVL